MNGGSTFPYRLHDMDACVFVGKIPYGLGSETAGKNGLVKTKFLHGKAALPKAEGFSRTLHYDLSSKARINYQYCDDYRTNSEGDPHKVVFILTIDFSSH